MQTGLMKPFFTGETLYHGAFSDETANTIYRNGFCRVLLWVSVTMGWEQ